MAHYWGCDWLVCQLDRYDRERLDPQTYARQGFQLRGELNQLFETIVRRVCILRMIPIAKPTKERRESIHGKVHEEHRHALTVYLAHPVRADCVVQLEF
jgi:hypothetical protein